MEHVVDRGNDDGSWKFNIHEHILLGFLHVLYSEVRSPIQR